MLPYSIASKYPARPCRTPAWGMWKFRLANRELWLLVTGSPTAEGFQSFNTPVNFSVLSPRSFSTTFFTGCANSQHSWMLGPAFPPPPPPLRVLTALNITTYGVSDFFKSPCPPTSLNNLVEERGAMCAVYDDGIEIPLAGPRVQSGKR